MAHICSITTAKYFNTGKYENFDTSLHQRELFISWFKYNVIPIKGI